MTKKLTIGLIGFGCVGSGLYEVLNKSKLIDADIKTIVVKDPNKSRSLPIDHFHFDLNDVLEDDEINVIIELINDSDIAYDIVKKALKSGKDVVTANKKLLAEHIDELIALARANGVSFLYEGAVAGSIPIIRNLEEYYDNETLRSFDGILNGTTNYILTKSNSGIDYETALKEAQELGFAELNPTLDVDGFDSKYKLVLLIKHAFGVSTTPDELFNVGIRTIDPNAINHAIEKGYRIKLLSRAEKIGNEIVGFVAPHFLDEEHFAYAVDSEFNAVIVQALFSEKQLFIGKGAGSFPTASAVLSDVSALKFDYKYEYRKSDSNRELSCTNEFFLKVYIGSTNMNTIEEISFYRVDEVFQSETYCFIIGHVKFNELRLIDFNSRPDLTLIVFSEGVQKSLDSDGSNQKIRFSTFETVFE